MKKECGQSIKALRADRGGEYLSLSVPEETRNMGGIKTAHTSQQNGVSEGTLVEAARPVHIGQKQWELQGW